MYVYLQVYIYITLCMYICIYVAYIYMYVCVLYISIQHRWLIHQHTSMYSNCNEYKSGFIQIGPAVNDIY